jgi:hypothetical protein
MTLGKREREREIKYAVLGEVVFVIERNRER